MNTSLRNQSMSVLFVGDPNLGERGFDILENYFQSITRILWARGDLITEQRIRKRICEGEWDILLSFYNDLIFTPTELSHAHVKLNIHPSLPHLRGRGYDTLPLILGDSMFGVTLHNINRNIDAGTIVEVMEEEVPEGIGYQQFRALTQKLCLEMLDKTAREISGFDDPAALSQRLETRAATLNRTWDVTYYSGKAVDRILDDFRRTQPDHRVFR